MGILLKKIIDEECTLAVWEIVENYDDLLCMIKLNDKDISTLKTFSNLQRKREWLCTRVLLKELTHSDSEIIYNEEGKPLLADNSFNISISHSKSLVSVIVSKNRKVGIDIENISNKIEKIAHKFLGEKELSEISHDDLRLIHLYLCWSAKETLYKIFSGYKLNFIENINIMPFKPLTDCKFYAKVTKDDIIKKCTLNYEIINNYVLIWCYI